jgi:shikimate dehydrogenase
VTVSGHAIVAGVFGWPVSHSLSPHLHGYWLGEHGIDGAYIPLPVPPDAFPQVVRLLPTMGMVGANVTLPHKEAALAAVDEADGLAQRIGAVNTIVVRPDGSLFGRNSDASGFIGNLTAGAPDWRPEAGPAAILGAGGAARAIAVALFDAGVPELRIVNRTVSRAEAVADLVGDRSHVSLWIDRARALDGAALVINTTSLGMVGAAPLDLDLDHLPPDAVVTDTVYTPLETPLLVAARARGNLCVDGLGMLLHQGRMGFAAWYGAEPEVSQDLRDFIVAKMKK